MTIEVRVVDGAATRELRRAVLRPGWPADSAMHGDADPAAIHLAALDDDGSVVGSCVLLPKRYPLRPEQDGAWQLRGMATAAHVRGQGIGAALLDRALVEIEQRDGRLVWCEARTGAVEFYRRHGFAVDGREFAHAETGLPHHHMSSTLTGEVGT